MEKENLPEKKRIRKDLSWSGNENMKAGDRGRYLRHCLGSWDLEPVDISDPEQVENRIYWYFNRCADDDIKPSVSGICSALGIDRDTFYNWGIGRFRKDTHQDLVVKTKKLLEHLWETYMLENKINATVGIFLGKNHYGYRDVKDVTVEPRRTMVEDVDMREVIEIYSEQEKLE